MIEIERYLEELSKNYNLLKLNRSRRFYNYDAESQIPPSKSSRKCCIKGKPGVPGKNGKNGKPGINGANGMPGKPSQQLKKCEKKCISDFLTI